MKKMMITLMLLCCFAIYNLSALNHTSTTAGSDSEKKSKCDCEINVSYVYHDTRLNADTMPSAANEFKAGCIHFPPGETPESLGLLSYNSKAVTDYTVTSVTNKMNTAPTTGNYHIPVLLLKFSDMQAPDV